MSLTSFNDKPNIVEFIGPPGVGKSTVYKSLCSKWDSNLNWTYFDSLLTSDKPTIFDFKKWLIYQLWKYVGKKKNPSISVDYGLRFVDYNKELANFCWEHLSSIDIYKSEDIGKRFRSAYFLFSDFCKYQVIFENAFTKLCIRDEGFLQKSFLVHADKQYMAKALEKYLLLLPLPCAVIYINTPNKDEILNRIMQRKKIIASHLNKDKNALLVDIENWQNLFSLIIKEMQSRNIPVYHIDGEKPIEQNVLLINNILSQQCVSHQ